MDGRDVLNEINTAKGLSHSWETRKGHLFQIESLGGTAIFSIDNVPFEEFMFPRPVRSASDWEVLEVSSDEEDEDIAGCDGDVLPARSSVPSVLEVVEDDSDNYQYLLDIEVINPTVQKRENYVTYTV